MLWQHSMQVAAELRMSGSEPGIAFTPPGLAARAVACLTPGRAVVDLGAGTGSLAFEAAFQGHRVVAIEDNEMLVRHLETMRRRLGLQNCVDVVHADAFAFPGVLGSQVISNPPYTRHQLLGQDVKDQLAASAASHGIMVPRTAGEYVYFMVHAWLAEWSHSEVFVVPTNWLEANYGSPIRNYLANHKKTLVQVSDPSVRGQFPNLGVTTSVVLTSALEAGEPPRFEIQSFSGGAAPHLSPHGPADAQEAAPRLGDFVSIHRGIATGANRWFVLTDDELEESNLREDEVQPLLRRLPRLEQGPSVQWLWTPTDSPSRASRARIETMERESVHRGTLCRMRDPWWHLGRLPMPELFLSCLWRGSPLLVENERRLTHLNNVHGLSFDPNASPQLRFRLVEWLQSTEGIQALARQARHLDGGLRKLEPHDAYQVCLPGDLFD